jgi:hypothetical protein
MFNAAALAVAPPVLRENAPMPCPVEVNNLLSKYTQFRNHKIEWDDSEARVAREHPGLTPGGHADSYCSVWSETRSRSSRPWERLSWFISVNTHDCRHWLRMLWRLPCFGASLVMTVALVSLRCRIRVCALASASPRDVAAISCACC